MRNKITTKQLAEKVGLTYVRINQLIQQGIIEADKFGRDYLIDEKYIDVIKNRPENRGRYERRKVA